MSTTEESERGFPGVPIITELYSHTATAFVYVRTFLNILKYLIRLSYMASNTTIPNILLFRIKKEALSRHAENISLWSHEEDKCRCW